MTVPDLSPDDEVYMVAGRYTGASKPIHTQTDCLALKQASGIRTILYKFVDDRSVCKYCTGENENQRQSFEEHPCEYCDRVYATANGHSRHVLMEHAEEISALNDDPPLVTDGGLKTRQLTHKRDGGDGLPPARLHHEKDQVWLFTCVECGKRWTDPLAPVSGCGCGGNVVGHRFDFSEYWRIRVYSDPREPVPQQESE